MKQRGLVLPGYQQESATPLYTPDADFLQHSSLDSAEDRSWIAQHRYFLKRKFMSTGKEKTLWPVRWLISSMTSMKWKTGCSFRRCSRLEQAKQDNYDFETNPVVSSHLVTVDRRLLQTLKSNDCLHLLVTIPETVPAGKELGNKGFPQQLHRCFGLLTGNRILSRAEVAMHRWRRCCRVPPGPDDHGPGLFFQIISLNLPVGAPSPTGI